MTIEQLNKADKISKLISYYERSVKVMKASGAKDMLNLAGFEFVKDDLEELTLLRDSLLPIYESRLAELNQVFDKL